MPHRLQNFGTRTDSIEFSSNSEGAKWSYHNIIDPERRPLDATIRIGGRTPFPRSLGPHDGVKPEVDQNSLSEEDCRHGKRSA